jgi:hypothetical protein
MNAAVDRPMNKRYLQDSVIPGDAQAPLFGDENGGGAYGVVLPTACIGGRPGKGAAPA